MHVCISIVLAKHEAFVGLLLAKAGKNKHSNELLFKSSLKKTPPLILFTRPSLLHDLISPLYLFGSLFACIACLFSKMSSPGLKLASGALNLDGLDRVTQLTKETERSDAQPERPWLCFRIFLRDGFYQQALVSDCVQLRRSKCSLAILIETVTQ